jgi:spermidine/putrescine transport system substrate-binding protein
MSDEERSRIEMAIVRAMRKDRISRRTFLGRAGRGGIAIGAALTLPGLIAACQPEGVTIQWANWPAYIDIDEESSPNPTPYPTLNAFIEQTGINVNYQEVINDNEEFFGTIFPDLEAGNPTGWDIVTPTDWMVEKLIRLGYIQELDHSKLPNLANAADFAVDQWFDPGNAYSVYWQGGITGIGYNPTLTGREITSFEDLFDPEFKDLGVGLFSDTRDMLSLTLLSLGIVPANATIDDATRAQEKLLAAAEDGQFRGFYGNEYYDELAAGNLALTVAWSGDVTQMKLYDNADVEFVVPAEGGMRWNDNLVIPNGSTILDAVHQLMNYWYDPVPATTLAEYIGYFSPVAEVPDRIREDAQAARDAGDDATADELDVFAATVAPTEDQIGNTYPYKQLTEEEEAVWNDLWGQVMAG